MGVIIPEGFFNTSFIFNCQGLTDEIITSLATIDDPLDPRTATSMADSMRNIWGAAGRPFAAGNMTTEYTFVGCRTTKTVDGEPVLGESLTSIVGTQSIDSIPANTAVLVKKNTAAGGRRNRGRMFLPAVALQGSDVLPSGFLATGEQAARQTQVSDALAAMLAADIFPVLLHSDGGTPTAIVSLAVASQVATQRRRMR